MYFLESVRQELDEGLNDIGLSQVLWGNFPRRRNGNSPWARVLISFLGRARVDLAAADRSTGFIRVEIGTEYGKDPKGHDRFVNGSLRVLSDLELENVQFFTSYPETLGRRQAWWVTRIETPFYLEGV